MRTGLPVLCHLCGLLVLRPGTGSRDARGRVDGQVERAANGDAVGGGEFEILSANLPIKVSCGGQLAEAAVLQRRLVALEVLDSRLEVAAVVVLDVINDKGRRELAAAGNALDESRCGRHLWWMALAQCLKRV